MSVRPPTRPWERNAPPAPGDYLPPDYYDQLLYDYTFDGRTDLDLLDTFLARMSGVSAVLELGSGSGRSTEVIRRRMPHARIELIDLSARMLEHTRARFTSDTRLTFTRMDSVDALARSGAVEVLVSMWNLSHSVHQHMFRDGRAAAEPAIRHTLRRFFSERLTRAAFLVHYDIQSDEQRLINPWRLELWRKADPAFDATGQSPSKLLLDYVLEGLANDGHIAWTSQRLVGDPIRYESAERALEVFMSFHMEGHFSLNHPRRDDVVRSLLSGFREYTTADGAVEIRPACFLYEVSR